VLSVKSFRKAIKAQQVSPVSKSGDGKVRQPEDETVERFPTLKEAEQLHIEEAMRRAGGNQGVAATLLGISRPALNRRLTRSTSEISD
jgi:DNA-binding NtrC family response regulator